MSKIKEIFAYEILDSRGIPTVAVRMVSDSGNEVFSSVPSGSSAGKSEAWELRDGGSRYEGKGVQKAVSNINKEIAPKVIGFDPEEQEKIDKLMLDFDGTDNKKNLGANAILAISLSSAKLAAADKNLPLYKYLNQKYFHEVTPQLPTPFSVVICGGAHSQGNLDIQEFMIVPSGFSDFAEKIEKMTEVYHKLGKTLKEKGLGANVGLEGAYAPNLKSNSEALDIITEVLDNLGLKDKVNIALDVASSEFFIEEGGGSYNLKLDEANLSRNQLLGLYSDWLSRYNIISIEDGLDEDDWSGWSEMAGKFRGKIELIGDDLFTTNPKRIKKGIDLGAASGAIIKPNQIGTLSETIEAIKILKEQDMTYIISHRSGETNDTFIADLAVSSGAKYIKTGAPSRGERVAKYNRLLEIEKEL
jgi:enolase